VKKQMYTMPYIKDADMYKAVQFALSLKKSMSIALSVYKAAKYYGVSQSELASLLGQIGARKSIKNRIHNAYFRGKSE